MMLYTYSLLDTESGEYSPLVCYPTDQFAGYEIVRLTLNGNEIKPFEVVDGEYVPCEGFTDRYRLMRLGLFNSSSGLVDGSCEAVDVTASVRDAVDEFCRYYNANGGAVNEG